MNDLQIIMLLSQEVKFIYFAFIPDKVSQSAVTVVN